MRKLPFPSQPRLRLTESMLLAFAAFIVLFTAIPLALAFETPLDWDGFDQFFALIGIALLLHLSLMFRRPEADQVILPILILLMGLSLSLQKRLAPALEAKQYRWIVLGCLVLALACHIDFEWRILRRYRYTWASLGIMLIILTLFLGRSAIPGGPALWLGVGSLSFQPAELLKLLLVVFMAAYLEDKQELLSQANLRIGRLRLLPIAYLAPLGLVLGLSLALLAVQGDLGAALLLFSITLSMLFLASARIVYVIAGLASFAVGAMALYQKFAIVQARVSIWLDPWADPQGRGYQLIQALLAMAAGGVAGTGIGMGLPTNIPAVHTDFVYAAIVEELGLAGASAVLLLYALLMLRGMRIAVYAPTAFLQLLAGGLTIALTVQTLIIVGGVVRIIPLTGITLPFLSYGGTSILTSALAAGLLMRISGESL